MHLAVLTLLAIVLILIYKNEQFLASFDMMINKSLNPILVNYMGRLKDARGYDYYDQFLHNQLAHEYRATNESKF